MCINQIKIKRYMISLSQLFLLLKVRLPIHTCIYNFLFIIKKVLKIFLLNFENKDE